MKLYNNVLVVVDVTGNELTRARITEFVKLLGQRVHLVYLVVYDNPEYVIASEVGTSLLAGGGTEVQVANRHVQDVQEYVKRLRAEGIDAHGEIMSSTRFGREETIVDLAKSVEADLIILNTEQGGQRAKARLAEKVARHSPQMAVLIARSTADQD